MLKEWNGIDGWTGAERVPLHERQYVIIDDGPHFSSAPSTS